MTPSSWWRGNNILWSQYALSLGLITLSLPNALALQVVSGSNCTNSCLSTITSYTTNGSDITCHDTDYNSSVPGGAFQECVSCEVRSEAFDGQTRQTDLGWAFCKLTVVPIETLARLMGMFRQYEIHIRLVYLRLSSIQKPIRVKRMHSILRPNI